jgi:hypothetical protein
MADLPTLVLTLVYSFLGFAGFYFSYKALKLYEGDIMHRVFALMSLAFLVSAFIAVFDAVFLTFGTPLASYPLLSVAGIITTSSLLVGIVSLLRWETRIEKEVPSA